MTTQKTDGLVEMVKLVKEALEAKDREIERLQADIAALGAWREPLITQAQARAKAAEAEVGRLREALSDLVRLLGNSRFATHVVTCNAIRALAKKE